MSLQDQISAAIRLALAPMRAQLAAANAEIATLKARGGSDDEEGGRLLAFDFVGTSNFVAADDGKRGTPIPFLVSQDGPFIMTHYPLAMWKPTLPTSATNFGRWRPVSSWPSDEGLPTQDSTLGIQSDIVDLSYELIDGGSQRNLQNIAKPSGMLSTASQLKLLPKKTRFAPNTTIQFVPTYENVIFGSGGTPTTQGTLVIVLPGYRIIGNVHS